MTKDDKADRNPTPDPPNQPELRRRADQLLSRHPKNRGAERAEDYEVLIHERQVHQVELELQNRELQQAEDTLHLREAELRLLMDAVPALIAYVDTNGCYRQVNKNYARWFGLSPEEIRGRHMRDLLGETQWEKIKGYVEKALAGEMVVFERQLSSQGGEPHWMQAIYSPEFDELNRVRGFVAHVMDIEGRKKTEKELFDSRDDLNRAQAVAHTGSWRLDIRRNELLWSDENYRIFGIPQGTPLTYETFLGAVHPDDRSYADGKWMAALRGEPYDIEHRLVVDGQIKWVRKRAELEFDPEGVLLGGFGTTQDITELKAAEEAIKAAKDELELRVQERTAELKKANEHLAEQSRILESFFKDTITPLVLLDRDFNFIRVNEAYARACQRAVSDFPGHNHFEFYPHKENEAIFRQVVKTGIPYQALAKPFSFPDHPEWGVTYWDWILTPLPDDRGETAFLVFSLEEVTDRQTAEDALRLSERQLRTLTDQLLHTQENERQRVAQDVHDSLGASLSALKYKLEGLAHDLSKKEPRQIEETLGSLIPIIQETIGETRRMQNELRPPLLDDLGILPTLTWFLREFQKIYTRIAIEQRLEILEEEVPDLLKVVIFRITQEALNNIGKHARATQIRIFLGREEDRLKLVIQDNGMGLDSKRLPESVDPGTGMGLSSMKERTELSGGSFSIKSHPGQGTSIEVSWPLPSG
jgi:PAS domain S-box-containing protein